MKFNLQQFYKFCDNLKIESKERGLISLNERLGTQTYVMNEIGDGLANGVHFFVILKGKIGRAHV